MDKRRVEELKRRCVDDYKRMKVSFKDLLGEIGPDELLKFAHSLHLIDSIGLKLPW